MNPGDQKRERVRAALEHRESDRVPIGEFFGSSFVHHLRYGPDGREEFEPYRHWDLDLVVVSPNRDPHCSGIHLLDDPPDRPKTRARPFDGDSADWDGFPWGLADDGRRYVAAVEEQVAHVGERLHLDIESFVDRVDAYADDFCVFGCVCDPYEMFWRLVGPENGFVKMLEAPDGVAAFVDRLGDVLVGGVQEQAAASRGKISGIYIWGDLAHDRGLLMGPELWRRIFKPQIERLCTEARACGLKVIYHGGGNLSALFEDFIEVGVDAVHPLEVRAGFDVVELKERYGGRLAFIGNVDARILAGNDRGALRAEVLRKLNAAKGGGYILQSDHSIPEAVSESNYDYLIELVREHGRYPLDLEEFDTPIPSLASGYRPSLGA